MKARLTKFAFAFLFILTAAQIHSPAAQGQKTINTFVTTQQDADSKYVIFCPVNLTPSEKLYKQAKEFLETNPNADPAWKKSALRIVTNYELKQAYEKWQDADKTFFSSPNLENLNNLIGAGELYLEKLSTPDLACLTRLALATGFALLANFYHDTERAFSYAEKSLRLLEPELPPSREWSTEVWKRFRAEHRGRLWQWQGVAKLRQTKPDPDAAIVCLTKAAEAKDGLTFKDPNTYILRAEATTLLYVPLADEYKQINSHSHIERARKTLFSLIDNLVADYARIVVLTEKNAELKNIHANARESLATYLKISTRYDKQSEDDVLQLFRKEFGLQ